MKRTIVALVLALVMVLTAVGGVFAETAASLETQILGAWEITDIKGNSDGQDLGAVMQLIKSMGGSITMTFNQGGKYTMAYSVLGQSDSQDGTYQISGSQIIMDGATLNLTIDGDQAILADLDGKASMVLTRMGSVDTPEAGGSEGLIGRWKVINLEVAKEDDSTSSLAAALKYYQDAGLSYLLTFNAEGELLLEVEGGDGSLDDKIDYVVDGDQITLGEGIMVLTYALTEDNQMVLTQNGDAIVLEFVDEPQEVSKDPVPAGNGIEGTWSVTEVDGEGDGVEDFKAALQMGASVYMIFANGNLTMTMEFFGQSESQDLGSYTDNGSTVTIAGDPCSYTINGDTLTLDMLTVKMTLVRK